MDCRKVELMDREKVASELASIAKMLLASDVLSFSVPLLIRVMEYAKEDAETDMDLHVAVENMLQLSGEGKTLGMGDYDKIVAVQSKKAGSKAAGANLYCPNCGENLGKQSEVEDDNECERGRKCEIYCSTCGESFNIRPRYSSSQAASKIAASEIPLNELPAGKAMFAQKVSSISNAKISQVFDGIHGHIVVFKGQTRLLPVVLLFIAKNKNVRWFECDDRGFSIGM